MSRAQDSGDVRLAANARHFVNAFSIFVSEDALIRELDLKALGL